MTLGKKSVDIISQATFDVERIIALIDVDQAQAVTDITPIV